MELDNKNYANLTEEMLFNRYIGGDVKAFDELLKRTKGLIFSLIMGYVHSRPIAEEIFQEIYLKVCKKKDLFRESVSFKAWLVTICRNTCIDHTRRQKRTLKTVAMDVHEDEHRSLAERIPSEQVRPDEQLMVEWEDQELKGLLEKLPEEQHATFYSKVIMELTFEEIGKAMGCSANTAKSRYRYALETLRGLVKRKRLLEKAV